MNDKVDVFVALAPAMSPAGLRNGIVDALVKASPEVLFLAFGRRSILSSANMWQSILYPPIFVRIIDMSLSFLFNWSGKNISMQQKLAAYPHLYSFTSTKSVVHWFQIIRNKCFQMYDDDVQAPLGLGASDRYYKVAKFPTRNIKTPIVLVYGGSDSLVDIKIMLKELPRHTIAREVPHFEHLDFLWGEEVESLVFPHVFEALTAYAGRNHLHSSEYTSRYDQNGRLAFGERSDYSDGDPSSPSNADVSEISPAMKTGRPGSHTSLSHPSPIHTSPSTPQNWRYNSPTSSSYTDRTTASVDGTKDVSHALWPNTVGSMLGRNRKAIRRRNNSISSTRSSDSVKKFGDEGISIGAGKATLGVSSPSHGSDIAERVLNKNFRDTVRVG